MSTRTDHPPSRDGSPSRISPGRHAVLGGLAGLALLLGPVVLASVVAPGEDDGGGRVSTDASGTSLVARSPERVSVEAERISGFVPVTTTTTAPPTTTTTAPPTTTTAPPTTTTAPPPPPAENPAPPSNGGGFGDPGDYATWDALAQCESGGNWSLNTGNGYYGGLQFSAATWASVGGSGLPHEHSRETQIYYGQVLQGRAGWGQWPHCAAQLGLI